MQGKRHDRCKRPPQRRRFPGIPVQCPVVAKCGNPDQSYERFCTHKSINMSTIVPFQALRPAPELASQVASRPYDVLNSHEAREEAADKPYSFLPITKPEIDMPLDVDTHSQPVYDQAKKNLQAFIEKGIL